MSRVAAVAVVMMGLFGAGSAAHAEEPLIPGELIMMREPGDPVDVPDAVDDLDPIDIEVLLSYHLDIERSTITRRPAGGDATQLGDLASLSSRLTPEIRVGIFRDFAGTARLPIVLSRTRDISPIDASLTRVLDDNADQIFQIPMRSPERSGIEHIAFGLLGAPLNQLRNPSFPNWRLGAEAQISVGPSMAACNDSPRKAQVRCAAPGDVDRDGRVDAEEQDGAKELDPGITRGTVALVVHTAISRRIRYVEPFGSFQVKFEFPMSKTPLAAPTASATSMLPIRGEAEIGVGIIPWENRERFSRVWIDARVVGGFSTRGRDFSQLFDALGSSDADSLRALREVDGVRLYETGASTVAAYGTLGAATSIIWRASPLIRLMLNASVKHELEHVIVDDEPTDPLYRASLDSTEGRLSVASSILFHLGATGAVLF